MVDVPTQYQLYVNNAANQLGISPDIVAAQIYTESSWNPNAKSPAGAEGIAQFLPSTFSEYGSGSPYNVSDAFAAYTKYMGKLLSEYNGDVREALAAYNAGGANLSAGYSYADKILGLAGAPNDSTQSSGGVAQATPALWPSGITNFFSTLSSGVFWMRVLMVASGVILILMSLNLILGINDKIKQAAKATPEGWVLNAATTKKKTTSKPERKRVSKKAASKTESNYQSDLMSNDAFRKGYESVGKGKS